MFNKKTWTEVSRRFTPSNVSLKNVKGLADKEGRDFIMKLNYGFTTIEMKCNETGELKFYEKYGDQR